MHPIQRERKIQKGLLCAAAVACLLTGVAPADEFAVRFDGDEYIRFEDDGDIVLSRGYVVEHARLHEWTSELRRRNGEYGVKEFVVRNGYTQGTENIVALIDENRGNLYLRGQAERVTNLQANGNEQEVLIRSGGTVYAAIDVDGNLAYRGNIYEPGTHAPRWNLANQYAPRNYNYFLGHADYVDIDDALENICYKFVSNGMHIDPGGFSWNDLTCNHLLATDAHAEWQWDETVAKMFKAVRDEHGSEIHVTSAFRCPAYNQYIGSTRTSKHSYGRAFDFKKRDVNNNWDEFDTATAAGREGLSVANWDVAQDAETAEVDPNRIRLYRHDAGQSYTLQRFYDEGWTPLVSFPNNLPAGWNWINNGHCDTGQPRDYGLAPVEPR